MIKLIDLISMAGVALDNYKIHCAKLDKEWSSPLEEFFDGKFKEWQEIQNQRNFQCARILSLIHLENDSWLFAGVFDVNGYEIQQRKGKQRYIYSTKEVCGLEHLVGKAIIQFQKNFRASYLKSENYEDQLLLVGLRQERMTIGDFPGFNSILLSYRMLKTVIRESISSWKSALSSIAGIYLISDTTDGRHYVGSAYGGNGIWQRWMQYAENGDGGNKELKDLLKEKGSEHADNFQFSLLEVCDLNASDDYVIEREIHWKTVLKSREFGLNRN